MHPKIYHIFEPPQGSPVVDTRTNIEVQPSMSFPAYNRNHHLATGLIAAWPIWEGSGSKVEDIVGDKHGTFEGTTIWEGSQIGIVVDTGVDISSRINMGLAPWFPFNQDMSFSCWAKANALSQRIMWSWGAGDGFGANEIEVNSIAANNTISFMWGSSSIIVSGTFITGKWHHYAGTRKNGTIEFFIDGQSQGTLAGTVDASFTNQEFQLGGPKSAGRTWKGEIADFRLYDYALADVLIKQSAFDPWGLYKRGLSAAILGANVAPEVVNKDNFFLVM